MAVSEETIQALADAVTAWRLQEVRIYPEAKHDRG